MARWAPRRVIDLASALARYHFAEYITYRTEMYLWVTVGLLPLAMIFFWQNVEFPGDAEGAYAKSLTLYFIAIFVVRQLTTSVIIPEFDDFVTSGEFSYRLVRPLHPYWQFLVDQYMDPIFRLPAIAIWTGLVVVFLGAQDLVLNGDTTLAAVSLMLSLVVHYNLQFAMACLAFWFERIRRLDYVQSILYFFLGGGFAPLALLPEPLRTVALWTPFPYTLGLPAEFLAGTTPQSVLLERLAVQGLWAVALIVLALGIYRISIRRFSAVGG
ncbi:MAG: ABC-2 family transporter protein [Rhodospirillaceae bacterium]|nr:ABC-2 family transporter protein [Rhodospirillaceae bacterium]